MKFISVGVDIIEEISNFSRFDEIFAVLFRKRVYIPSFDFPSPFCKSNSSIFTLWYVGTKNRYEFMEVHG